MISRRDLLFGVTRRLGDAQKPLSGFEDSVRVADMAYAQGEYHQAKIAYQSVLQQNRSHKEARLRLGICHYLLGEYIPATDTLLLALKHSPGEVLAQVYLGLTYARRGQIAKCMGQWREVFAPQQVALMRELHVHRALFEAGEPLDLEDMVQAVERTLPEGRS